MQRMTKQRQAVFAELTRVPDFRSAQQIFEDLHKQGHKVGLATVYRNLQALADGRDVDVLRSVDGESLFRVCHSSTHHHHLVCRNCGHTEEIELETTEKWIHDIASAHGFTAVEHSVELFGLCQTCSASAADDKGPASTQSSQDAQ
mgnify:FL=1